MKYTLVCAKIEIMEKKELYLGRIQLATVIFITDCGLLQNLDGLCPYNVTFSARLINLTRVSTNSI